MADRKTEDETDRIMGVLVRTPPKPHSAEPKRKLAKQTTPPEPREKRVRTTLKAKRETSAK